MGSGASTINKYNWYNKLSKPVVVKVTYIVNATGVVKALLYHLRWVAGYWGRGSSVHKSCSKNIFVKLPLRQAMGDL